MTAFVSRYRCGCGSPDWVSAAPGTVPEATCYPAGNVVALRPDDGACVTVWCASCWPFWRDTPAKGAEAGA